MTSSGLVLLGIAAGIVTLAARRFGGRVLRRVSEWSRRRTERAARPPLVADRVGDASQRMQVAQQLLGGPKAKPEPPKRKADGAT